MKSISMRDERERIYLYNGMVLAEEGIDRIDRMFCRLLDRIAELKKIVSTLEGTRLNVLGPSHDTLLKAQIETKKMLEEMKVEVALMSRKLDHDHKAHNKIYKEIDVHSKAIERMEETEFERTETDIKRDKDISDIEEFIGDL